MAERTTDDSIRVMLSPSEMARRCMFYAQETGYIEEGFTGGGQDNLDSYLLLYVDNGQGVLEYENQKHVVSADEMFFIDCKKPHRIYSTDGDWHIFYLYFSGTQAAGYYDIIARHNSIIFKIENWKTMKSLFWQIISLSKKGSGYAELIVSLNITRILTEICMFCTEEIVHEAEYPDCVNRVFHHLQKHYMNKITLDQLSELYYVNKFHLMREFKRCAGTTVGEYLTTVRINKAKDLLRYSAKSIEEIALEIGYCNATHFIRAFSKRELVTPLFYRKQWTI